MPCVIARQGLNNLALFEGTKQSRGNFAIALKIASKFKLIVKYIVYSLAMTYKQGGGIFNPAALFVSLFTYPFFSVLFL